MKVGVGAKYKVGGKIAVKQGSKKMIGKITKVYRSGGKTEIRSKVKGGTATTYIGKKGGMKHTVSIPKKSLYHPMSNYARRKAAKDFGY